MESHECPHHLKNTLTFTAPVVALQSNALPNVICPRDLCHAWTHLPMQVVPSCSLKHSEVKPALTAFQKLHPQLLPLQADSNSTDNLCDQVSYSLRVLLRDYRKAVRSPSVWQTIVKACRGKEAELEEVSSTMTKDHPATHSDEAGASGSLLPDLPKCEPMIGETVVPADLAVVSSEVAVPWLSLQADAPAEIFQVHPCTHAHCRCRFRLENRI